MRMYLTFTKKGLVALLAAVLLCLFVGGELYAAGNIKQNGKTNAQRVAFIKSMGLVPQEECIGNKDIVIPERFGMVYENYNKLQLKAGYDLELYKGSDATVFTYSVETPNGYSGDAVANLIVYNGRIIGGDISSRELDGFMLPLGDYNGKTKT